MHTSGLQSPPQLAPMRFYTDKISFLDCGPNMAEFRPFSLHRRHRNDCNNYLLATATVPARMPTARTPTTNRSVERKNGTRDDTILTLTIPTLTLVAHGRYSRRRCNVPHDALYPAGRIILARSAHSFGW